MELNIHLTWFSGSTSQRLFIIFATNYILYLLKLPQQFQQIPTCESSPLILMQLCKLEPNLRCLSEETLDS